jgi:Na+/H+ antiporter NhaC
LLRYRSLVLLGLIVAVIAAVGMQVVPVDTPVVQVPAEELPLTPPAEEAAEAEDPPPAAAGTWLAVLPALLAIFGALLFRQVIVALFIGVWLGAWLITGNLALGWLTGLFATVELYVVAALTNPDYVAILLFTLMIGGMVGLIQKNGGTAGIVNVVVRWARSARRGQLATSVLGTGIFFDDYANTLIVGGTMRPITDSLRISREKLAYLVDSTAAPIATVALVTTWIGMQVGLIGTAVEGITGWDEGPYSIFLRSLAYSFYPFLALFFVYAVALTRRDFGPMLRAERRARESGQLFDPRSSVVAIQSEAGELEPKTGTPARLINAVVPIVVLVGGVIVGLFLTGEGDTIWEIIGDADSYRAMMWASLAAVAVAIVLSVGQRILTLQEAVDAWYAGMKAMLLAVIILILAWALAEVNDVLATADYLVGILSDAITPGFLPTLVFVLAAATAFATGSSWGTMAILIPLVVPLAWGVVSAEAVDPFALSPILYASISAVLAGAVWGDHCSPISDTTILSSLATQCDHIDHVRTQLPYALVVGAAAVLLGLLPIGFGVPWWLCLPVAAAVLFAILQFFGRTSEPVAQS